MRFFFPFILYMNFSFNIFSPHPDLYSFALRLLLLITKLTRKFYPAGWLLDDN